MEGEIASITLLPCLLGIATARSNAVCNGSAAHVILMMSVPTRIPRRRRGNLTNMSIRSNLRTADSGDFVRPSTSQEGVARAVETLRRASQTPPRTSELHATNCQRKCGSPQGSRPNKLATPSEIACAMTLPGTMHDPYSVLAHWQW